MIGAKLWKRILNEGLIHFNNRLCQRDVAGGQLLAHKIISTTIIVDSLPEDHLNQEMWWATYRGMALPFSNFWIETCGTQGVFFEKAGESEDLIHCNCAVVMATPKRPVTVIALAQFDLTRDGSLVLLDKERWPIVTELHPVCFTSKENYVVGEKAVFMAMSDAFDVLMILSCKNVSLEPHKNEPKEARRAAKRHGGSPDDYRYHTLVVRPPGAKPDSPGQDIGIMPRHVCRGHFAEYGPEFKKGLLFGKYSGRFYIPPHLKGKKENGIVEKDYAVAAQ